MYFIGCFIGYIIETLLKIFFFQSMNNGVLYGPWIPLYGFGFLIIIFISSILTKIKASKLVKAILLFFFLFFIITILEEIGGLLIQAFFHKTFWSYKKLKFNIGPYISLEMSLLWSILGLGYTFYFRPFLDLFIKKIPKVVTLGILILHIIDIVFTWLI